MRMLRVAMACGPLLATTLGPPAHGRTLQCQGGALRRRGCMYGRIWGPHCATRAPGLVRKLWGVCGADALCVRLTFRLGGTMDLWLVGDRSKTPITTFPLHGALWFGLKRPH